jgi:hypothetical protein
MYYEGLVVNIESLMKNVLKSDKEYDKNDHMVSSGDGSKSARIIINVLYFFFCIKENLYLNPAIVELYLCS